ncbi:MAG: rhomboid family intramembrane serine protease [Chitinophagales bacterium]|nr:rhomboid family intramembrane serine protease [Chitinophagales bacterium]
MSVEILVYIIIAANVLFSWQGFDNHGFFEKYKFRVGSIIQNKEYYRLITSGFLHADMTHLIVNMITFYSFGLALQSLFNLIQFLIIYFGSLILGNLLALFINKNNYNYSAIGASGAVSGVVFACILFAPFQNVYLFFFLPIKFWIFGVLYLLYTVYGMNKQNDNIGHEAHLGGALAGLALAIAFKPYIAFANWWITLLLLVIPLVLFFIKPKALGGGTSFRIYNDNVKPSKRSVDDLYYNKEFEREKELNAL